MSDVTLQQMCLLISMAEGCGPATTGCVVVRLTNQALYCNSCTWIICTRPQVLITPPLGAPPPRLLPRRSSRGPWHRPPRRGPPPRPGTVLVPSLQHGLLLLARPRVPPPHGPALRLLQQEPRHGRGEGGQEEQGEEREPGREAALDTWPGGVAGNGGWWWLVMVDDVD